LACEFAWYPCTQTRSKNVYIWLVIMIQNPSYPPETLTWPYFWSVHLPCSGNRPITRGYFNLKSGEGTVSGPIFRSNPTLQ
jgi:hypothetical protein